MITILSEKPLSGWDRNYLEEKCVRAGILKGKVAFLSIKEIGNGGLCEADQLSTSRVLIPTDEVTLRATTGLNSIHKWHLSPLDAIPGFAARKVIPTFSPNQVKAQWELGLYVEKALIRAREEYDTQEYTRKPLRFKLNPSLEETLFVLEELRSEPILSVDIETGRGQINTVGFAWTESDAIAINVLPDRLCTNSHYELWRKIALLLESDARKVCQNGIYEFLFFARYGIHMSGLWHDTMVAQKFLWPELDKDLGNVGRLYTRQPYWKDDGKVTTSEGGKKDWGNIRDWLRHYDYNCKDTTGTLEAAVNQRADLSGRGQLTLFDSYVMPRHKFAEEMCLRGLPVNKTKQVQLISEYEARSAELTAQLSVPINPRSAKQKLKLFKDKGYTIPKKAKKQKDGSRKSSESTDELALKKLRLKYPDDTDIQNLLEIAKLEKALSSYLRVKTDPLDDYVRYTIGLDSTETGRWACYMDPWDRGFNAQTLTKQVKKMIEWGDV